MIYAPIWKDTYFHTSSSTLNYSIVDYVTGQAIHTGFTKKMPIYTGITTDINNKVEEYLNPLFDNIQYGNDFLAIISDVLTESNAYKEYAVTDSQTNTVLENYGFLYEWSYEENWTGQTGYNMSNPINGHADPRMKLFFGIYNTGQTDYNYDIDDEGGEGGGYYLDNDIIVIPEHLTYPASGGSRYVRVISDLNWSASTDTGLVDLDITSHTYSNTAETADVVFVEASVGPYITGGEVGDTITFDTGDIQRYVTALQDTEGGSSWFYVSPINFNVEYWKGSIGINVFASGAWTITNYSEWLTPSVTAGTGNTLVTVDYKTNEGSSARTGTISFSSGDYDKVVTVVQNAINARYDYLTFIVDGPWPDTPSTVVDWKMTFTNSFKLFFL